MKTEIEIEKEIIINTTKEKMNKLLYIIQDPFYIKKCTHINII